MATSFQECIAMDLKFYKGRIVRYLIDHTTRLSVSSFVKSKQPEVILKAIFKSWIQIYDAPEKFLTNNGSKFTNSEFIDMAESMNITDKVTAAESPFSNRLVGRHNFIIGNMMDKTLDESQLLHMHSTLPWCLNAKNSPAKVHGFSPFQLVFGQNPKLPTTFANKPPALVQPDTSKILTDKATQHKGRQEFILSKSSEKILRALNINVQTSGDTKYITG